MTIEELRKIKINEFVYRTYGARKIKYHVALYVGHTLTEPNRQILPVFKLLPLDKTEKQKYLHEFNCENYEVIKKC